MNKQSSNADRTSKNTKKKEARVIVTNMVMVKLIVVCIYK
jgi:hypothetical protein